MLEPGQAFSRYEPRIGMTHYYLQRENDVLHTVSDERIINLVPSEYLAEIYPHCKKITPEQFAEVIKKVLLTLGLGEFLG